MSDLQGAIRRLTAEGGDANRLVLEAGDAWVVLDAGRGRSMVRLRASDGTRRSAPAQATSDLAHLATTLLGDPQARVREQPGDRLRLKNGALLDGMRTLAQARDMSTRQGVYLLLVRAHLALLVQGDRPHAVEVTGGAPIYAVFTDWSALDAFDPRIQPHRVMPGHELFPHLAAHEIGGLLINPGGRVGGELYRHEVLTVCDGIRRMVGR